MASKSRRSTMGWTSKSITDEQADPRFPENPGLDPVSRADRDLGLSRIPCATWRKSRRPHPEPDRLDHDPPAHADARGHPATATHGLELDDQIPAPAGIVHLLLRIHPSA